MAQSGRRVIAPASTVATVAATGAGQPSVIEIAHRLGAAAERLAALDSYTPQAEPHTRELRAMRLPIPARMVH